MAGRSFAESIETPRTATPLSRYAFSSRARSGNSSRQGTHQVAQKFTRTTRPLRAAMAEASPFASSSPASFGALPSGAAETIPVRKRAAMKAAPITRVVRSGLGTLDRAAERLRLGLRDGLSREDLVERVLEVRRGHLRRLLVVLVDPAVVQQLAVGAD